MEQLALSVAQAAEILGISKSTMYQLVHSAGFPSVRIGKRLLVPARGLERWIAEREGETNDENR